MNKTVASVIDDINEWENPRGGSVFYVTAVFTDESVGSVGRKDHDAALEVQGLLRESIGVEQDFVLEPKGQTKTGREKWKILGFGTPGGAATYTAPGVGAASSAGGPAQANPAPAPTTNTEASIRAAVALKAAVEYVAIEPRILGKVLDWAEEFDAWLQRKASEPASSAYPSGGGPPVAADSTTPAGAGSEQSSGGLDRGGTPPTTQTPLAGPGLTPGPSPQETRPLPADSAGLVDSGEGEAPESTPHYVTDDDMTVGARTHEHDWQPHPQLRGKLKCECGAMRNKVA